MKNISKKIHWPNIFLKKGGGEGLLLPADSVETAVILSTTFIWLLLFVAWAQSSSDVKIGELYCVSSHLTFKLNDRIVTNDQDVPRRPGQSNGGAAPQIKIYLN